MPVKRPRMTAADLLSWQMRSIPVLKAGVTVESISAGRTVVTVPLVPRGWVRAASLLAPVRKQRRYELDRLALETFEMVDGRRTVEEMIDIHMARWKLSFFEARGMILDFLRLMIERGIIILRVPDSPERMEPMA